MGSNSIIEGQLELSEQAKLGRLSASNTIRAKVSEKNQGEMFSAWDKYWSQVWRTSEFGQGEAKDSLATFPGRLPWSY